MNETVPFLYQILISFFYLLFVLPDNFLPSGVTSKHNIFVGSAAQRGLWPPRFLITRNEAPQSVGLLWTSDQLVAEGSI
jgi:hypothetical protein